MTRRKTTILVRVVSRTVHCLMAVLLAGVLSACAGGVGGTATQGGGAGGSNGGFNFIIGSAGGGDLGRAFAAVQSGAKVADAVVKSNARITPEQEYYIGRAVGAQILRRYGIYEDADANLYVNQVGQALAVFCEAPDVFAGYHFVILDSDQINAFAAPGAFIFVTRGMLRCAQGEDELAAVLAHEIAHVQNRDAIKSIKESRWTKALTLIATEAVQHAGRRDVGRITDVFGDIVGDMVETLITKGYSREQEMRSDLDGVRILTRAGYNPHAMITMLGRMHERLKPRGVDFARTHPGPQTRIAKLRPAIQGDNRAVPRARKARFKQALAGALSRPDDAALTQAE